MTGRGEVSDNVSEGSDSDLLWAWEQVAEPGHTSSPLPYDPVRGTDKTATADSLDLGLPESLWGDGPPVGGSPVPTRTVEPASHSRAPKVAALALVVVAGAALLLAVAARGPESAPGRASQQIDAAGLPSTSTMPTVTVPRAPSTSLTTTIVTTPQADSISGEAPATTVTSPPAAATAATTPARAEAPVVPVPSSQDPPAPTPTFTVTTPPPTTIALLPVEPETTVTTRRPRSTVPDTTVAASTTVPAPDDQPVGED